MPIAPIDNGYASPTPTRNPITPPQSSKEVLVSLELSVPREGVEFSARGHRKTRARTRYSVAVEGSKEDLDNFKSRKNRKR